MSTWKLNSWRSKPIKHQPVYADKGKIDNVLKELSTFPPLVFAGESRSLKKLEYRGYDSAGLATLSKNIINEKKCSGRVETLEKILFKTPSDGNIGIGHVRWATHGVPNSINAHPHSTDQVSVVHNGIIENSDEIKKELRSKGIKFKSQTDTEVVTLLITEALKDNTPLASVFKTIKKLKGSFALGIIFKNFSDIIIGARRVINIFL